MMSIETFFIWLMNEEALLFNFGLIQKDFFFTFLFFYCFLNEFAYIKFEQHKSLL